MTFDRITVGPAVTRFTAGGEVLGIGRCSYAEYALATESKLAPSRGDSPVRRPRCWPALPT